jgi:hypothetical protein
MFSMITLLTRWLKDAESTKKELEEIKTKQSAFE